MKSLKSPIDVAGDVNFYKIVVEEQLNIPFSLFDLLSNQNTCYRAAGTLRSRLEQLK